jgi:hypothetical protein
MTASTAAVPAISNTAIGICGPGSAAAARRGADFYLLAEPSAAGCRGLRVIVCLQRRTAPAAAAAVHAPRTRGSSRRRL